MNLDLLSQVIPQIVVIALVAGVLGWLIRGKSTPAPKAAEPAPRERPRSDAALEQARANNKALKAELDTLRADSVPRAELDAARTELNDARQTLSSEQNRAAALDTDLRKARETIRQLNAKNTESDKARNDRTFALENELSKTREQLALLQSQPDDTARLQAEIDRLRESVATTTRYAGELRKREAAAQEALAKTQERAANSPAPAAKAAPVRTGDSDRVIAAKAEVARLNAMREAAPPEPPAAPDVNEEAAPAPEAPAAAEEPQPAVAAEPQPAPEESRNPVAAVQPQLEFPEDPAPAAETEEDQPVASRESLS